MYNLEAVLKYVLKMLLKWDRGWDNQDRVPVIMKEYFAVKRYRMYNIQYHMNWIDYV